VFNFFLFNKDKIMKKVFITAFLLACFPAVCALAEEAPENAFFEDVLLSEDIKEEEESTNAKDSASRLLDSKPKIIRIEGQNMQFRKYQPPVIIDTTTKYGEAPFGLSWGATYNQTKALGVEMKKIERKDSVNSFTVTKLPKPLSDFDKVIVSFGEDNLLWRIVAYGKPQEDDNAASKAMHLYRRYYKLLNQKYGNGKEFFTPKISTIEKSIKDEYGKEKIEIIKQEHPKEGETFLQELQNKEAVLYATFEDNNVGAALTVAVNGQGQSYIIIDYTNLKIYREREEKALNAL